MKVSVHPLAADELRVAAKFYSDCADQALGLAFIAEFERATNPELAGVWHSTARRFSLRRFPYNLIYQITADELRVSAVAHQRRRPNYWEIRK